MIGRIIGLLIRIILVFFLGFQLLLFALAFIIEFVPWLLPVLIVLPFYLIYRKMRNKRRKKKEQEKLEKEAKEAYERKVTLYTEWKTAVVSRYGNPDKDIIIEPYDMTKEVVVFLNHNYLLILGKELPFSLITGYSILNDEIEGDKHTESLTRTNDGNMYKRGLLGWILGGDAGMIVGGSTAEKRGTSVTKSGRKINDYTFILYVNDINNPSKKLHIGSDESIKDELIGVMNILKIRRE